MQPQLCSRCKKNIAVVFITRQENGQNVNEGLCLKCAKNLGLPQVDEMMRRMGITDEDLDNISNEMMGAFGGAENLEGLTAADDPKAKTVMELVPDEYRRLGVMPVGRLDKDTEGLLLLTNDGDLAHRILSPRHGVWKRYYAEHEGRTGPEDVRAFEQGLVLADGLHCLPAKLTPLSDGRSIVCVQEGKYHQVRRMLASRGCPVTYLRREAEGGLTLGSLPLGQTKELDIVEAEGLLQNIL